MNENILAGFLTPHPPIIVPDIGRGRQSEAADTVASMKRFASAVKELNPDTVVVISPHAPMYRDFVYFYGEEKLVGNLDDFGGSVEIELDSDREFIEEVEKLMEDNHIKGGRVDEKPAGFSKDSFDHGAFVPLYFLKEEGIDFKAVILSPSYMDIQMQYTLGSLLTKAANSLNRKTVVIASGDLSHKVNSKSPYGASVEGSEFDNTLIKHLKESDMKSVLTMKQELRENAAECGYGSIVMMAGVFDGRKIDVDVYSYEAPFGIGYSVANFTSSSDEKEENLLETIKERYKAYNEYSVYVRVARDTLKNYIEKGIMNTAANYKARSEYDVLFKRKAGVFVTLKKFGELRGCIGTLEPMRDSIIEEIIHNSISAGIHDPRFNKVEAHELPFIECSVDVLSKPEPVKDLSNLDPNRYGIIVSRHGKRGVLLPNISSIMTVEKQLNVACQKAGINPNDDFKIQRFEVQRYL